MFLRILILFFAINSLIPSATALMLVSVGDAGDMSRAPSQMMAMADLAEAKNTMGDVDSADPGAAMSKSCTMGSSCMMDMDSSCDSVNCSSGYAVSSVDYFAFLHGVEKQPHFSLAYYYHIVHPVRTPPPLV